MRGADAFGVEVEDARQPVHLARHAQDVRRLHLCLRADRGGVDLGARLSLRTRLLDLHRRMFAGDLGRAGLRHDGAGGGDRALRGRSSPPISTANRCSAMPRICAAPAAWLNFRRIKCDRWSDGKTILIGDAAHTAHFSIGSGTKLALEDAIKLAEVLNRPGLPLAQALEEYQAERAWKCSSCRTARAIRPNGSRRSSAISTSNRGNSPIRC